MPHALVLRLVDRWGSYRFKVTVATIATVVVGSAVLFAYWLVEQRRALEAAYATNQIAAARQLARNLEDKIQTRLMALDSFARYLDSDRLADSGYLERHLAERQVLPALFSGGALVVDPSGTVLADYPVVAGRRDFNVGDRRYVREALATARPVVGEPVMERGVKRLVLNMSAPAVDRDGRVRALVVGVTALADNRFLGLADDSGYLGPAEVALVSLRERVFIMHRDAARIMTELAPPGTSEIADRLRAGFEGWATLRATDGVEKIYSIVPLPALQWALVLATPTEIAFAPLRQWERRAAASALAVTLLAALAMSFLARRLTAPLYAATAKLDRMSSSAGSLAPLPVVGDTETRRLFVSFNRLLAHIEAQGASLQASEARFRTLAEQMPAVIYIAPADGAGPALYVSPAIASLGYTPQQWTSGEGPNWQQVMHPDDRERVLREIRECLAADRALRLEFRLRDSQGAWHDFIEHGRHVAGADGQRLVQGVMVDVSDLKRAQHELLVSRAELSDLAQRLLAQERDAARQLAQTLHDQLGQSLAVARLHLDATIVQHATTLPDAVKDDCARVVRALGQAIADVRVVLGGLRPPLLEDQGLVAALENEFRPRDAEPGEADVLLEVDAATATVRWPPDVEYGAFMIAREAAVNALLHASATLVRVIVEGDRRKLTLAVVDDGRGIGDALRQGRPGHLGLVGMRERALAIGARLDVQRQPEGGTCVTLHWQAGPSS